MLVGNLRPLSSIEDRLERLRRGLEVYLRFAADHPESYRLMFNLPGYPPGANNPEGRADDPDREAYGWLRQLVGDLVASGEARSNICFWMSVSG